MSEEIFVKFATLKNGEPINTKIIELPYIKLNNKINGIHKGDLILLESRPGMGTTTFCINLAVRLAKQKLKIAYLSLDLSRENIAIRIDKCLNNFKHDKNSKDFFETTNADDLEIYISKTQRWSDYNILVEMQELTKKHKIDLFILDYIQLIDPVGDLLCNSDQDIRDYIQSFKHAIRQFNAPLIVVSKLKNDVDNYKLMPPGLLDCNIDWATDVVIVLDRLEKYSCRHDVHGNSTENKFYLMVYKNKYGETTDIGSGLDFNIDFEKQIIEEI